MTTTRSGRFILKGNSADISKQICAMMEAEARHSQQKDTKHDDNSLRKVEGGTWK